MVERCFADRIGVGRVMVGRLRKEEIVFRRKGTMFFVLWSESESLKVELLLA